jgi:hypothetical protein
MLAVVGYIVADVARIPGDMYSFEAVPHAVDAHNALLTSGPMIQLAAYISLFDIIFTAPAIGAMNAGEREAGGKRQDVSCGIYHLYQYSLVSNLNTLCTTNSPPMN